MHLTPCYSLAFLLVPAFAAPLLQNRSTSFKNGDIVGVRPGELEGKSKATKDVSIHPGVVLGSPHPTTGKFPVAMISKKLPKNPPQAPIQDFYHGSALHGNIKLAPPKEIENAKPWKNQKTGGRQSPMTPAGVQKLRDAMKPHEGWRTPPGTPPGSPSPRTPSPKGKQKQGQSTPEWRRPPQVNAHASGSRLPVPAPLNHAARKPNPATAAHRNPSKQPAIQRPRPPQGSSSKTPAASQPRRPANQSPRPANRSPRPANRSPRPANRSPRPANRSPRPASRSSTRPGSPPNKPAGSPIRPKDKKGKQPVRGKREFIKRRAVRSDY